MQNLLGLSLLSLSAVCVLGSNGLAQTSDALPLAKALTGSVIRDRDVEFRNDRGQRGMTQRSLFMLGSGFETLKIAFVFDGTQSMQDDIQGLKRVLGDVVTQARQQTGARKVEVAFVVYRDLFQGGDDNPQHRAEPVTIHAQQRFGRQLFLDLPAQQQSILDRLNAIRVDTGLPGAWEQMDRGVYAGLTQLNWAPESGAKVGRVLILAGDSPPWPLEWRNQDPYWKVVPNSRLRTHTAESLIAIARKQHVKVFSIACRGWKLNQEIPELKQLRPELIGFLRNLARGTGGTFLDTRDETTRQRVLQAVADQGRRIAVRSIGTVTEEDIQRRRLNLKSRRIRIGILPNADVSLLNEDSFTLRNAGYLHALRLFHLLNAADARQVANLRDTRRVVRELSPEWAGTSDRERMRQLTTRLEVDLLIGVDVQRDDDGAEQLVLAFQPAGGQEFQKVIDPGQAKQTLAGVLSEQKFGGESPPSFAHDLKRTTLPISFRSSDSETLLTFALEDLHQASASLKGSAESREFNRSAGERLRRVLAERPQDAWGHLLLASVAHNLNDLPLRQSELKLAFQFRNQADKLVALEIEADHALFVAGNARQAVDRYRQLIADAAPWSNTALRARWMLAGICLGDFVPRGTNPEQLGFESWSRLNSEARNLVIDIMVYWPRSPQARFYRRHSETPEGTQPQPRELPAGSRLMYVEKQS